MTIELEFSLTLTNTGITVSLDGADYNIRAKECFFDTVDAFGFVLGSVLFDHIQPLLVKEGLIEDTHDKPSVGSVWSYYGEDFYVVNDDPVLGDIVTSHSGCKPHIYTEDNAMWSDRYDFYKLEYYI